MKEPLGDENIWAESYWLSGIRFTRFGGHELPSWTSPAWYQTTKPQQYKTCKRGALTPNLDPRLTPNRGFSYSKELSMS
jgi:hypothetical protein